MSRNNRELYFKPIGELTQKEFELLFNMPTDINDPNFRKKLKPIANRSIANINAEDYDINELDFYTAYLLGVMTSLQSNIPENKLIVIFGESGCGKSYLINLISKLKQMNNEQIMSFLGDDSKSCELDTNANDIKEMIDHIGIVPKKTTRPSRDGVEDKPEIKEGMSFEEVEESDWKYTIFGNLYGFSKNDIDGILNTGDAMMIVNDMEIMRQLKQAYPRNFLPILIYRAANEEEWGNLMQQGNRSREEIEKRSKQVGFSNKIYEEIFELEIPEVIFNLPEVNSNKGLLLQLRRAITRKERENILEK